MKTKFAVNLFQAVLLGLSLVGFSTPSHAQTPITCGQTITNTLSTPGQTVQYNYPGTAGQTLSVALFGTGAYLNGDWMVADIYGPDGKLLASVDGGSGGSGHAVNLTLTNSGTFLILVHESLYRAAYSYSLCVQSTTGGGCSSTAMLCGQTMSNKLSFNAEMDAYGCTGAAGQTLSVALFGTGAYLNGDWMVADIYSPGGQFLARVDGGSGGSGHAVNLTLTNSGTFTILVHESAYRAAYSYSLSIQSTTGGGCSSTPMLCGQTVSNMLGINAEIDAYSCTGTAGQTLSVALFGTGAYLNGDWMVADIYGPGGQLLASVDGGSGGSGHAVNLTLTNSGTFLILVHESLYRAAYSYSLCVQSTTGGGCSSTAMLCGQSMSNKLSFNAEMDAYSCTGTAGQTLSVALFGTGAYLNGDWMVADIYSPGGQFLARVDGGSSGSGHAVNLTLTNSGTFTILVHESVYRAAYSYFLSIQSTTGGGCSSTAIVCGQTMTNNISRQAEVEAFGLGASSGTTVIFSFSGFGGAQFEFYDPAGSKLFTRTPGTSTNIMLATSGAYTLLVHDDNYADTGSYSFTANCIGCSYSISPTSVSIGAAATNGNVSVTAGAGCNWTAETNASWLRITSGASGSGNGSVNYLVDANLGANARAGTMTIAGWTFIVNQAAAVAFVGHDVGDVSPLGGFDPSNGVFTVWGDGEDIEGTADAFYFVHEPLTGDGQIVARLLSLQGGSGLAEAGLMMRETLASGSRHVFLAANADKATTFRRRLATDAYSVQNSHPGTNYAWLRLMRMGNTFVGHCSTNGTNWEYVWFTTLNMPSQLQVGLAVTARSLGLLATGMLDNVSVGSLTPLSGTRPQAIHLGGEPLNAAEWARIGGYKMLLDGGVGDQFMVKCSTNVSANFASWLSLGTVTNTLGVADFLDPQALTNKLRFYRTERVGP